MKVTKYAAQYFVEYCSTREELRALLVPYVKDEIDFKVTLLSFMDQAVTLLADPETLPVKEKPTVEPAEPVKKKAAPKKRAKKVLAKDIPVEDETEVRTLPDPIKPKVAELGKKLKLEDPKAISIDELATKIHDLVAQNKLVIRSVDNRDTPSIEEMLNEFGVRKISALSPQKRLELCTRLDAL